MKNKTKTFHAVAFMRATRQQLSKLYLEDKDKYFAELEKVTKEFMRIRKKKAAHAA